MSNTNETIDLWDVNPQLGKKIDELICKRSEDPQTRLQTLFEAWELIPKPAMQFYFPTNSIALGISSIYVKLNDLEKALEWALTALEASKNMMSLSYPMSVGKIYYEMGNEDQAYHYFDMTYEHSKYVPFSKEDKKYWQFYKQEKEKKS